MLYFVFTLPPPGAADVVERTLSVTVGQNETLVLHPAVSDVESEELSGFQNDPIHAELVDTDDGGNVSQPSVFDGTLLDTIAPPQPGELGVRVTREEI